MIRRRGITDEAKGDYKNFILKLNILYIKLKKRSKKNNIYLGNHQVYF